MYYAGYEEQTDRKAEILEKYTLLTPVDVMEILGIGKNTVYSLLNSGKLSAFRVGRSWRIPAESLEQFMLCAPNGRT